MKKIIFWLLLVLAGYVNAANTMSYTVMGAYASSSPDAACAAAGSANGLGSGVYAKYISSSRWDCTLPNGNYAAMGSVGITGVCTAPDAIDPTTHLCKSAKACPPVGQQSGDGMEAKSSGKSLNICDGSCGYTAAGGITLPNGDFIVFGPMTSTGACTPPATPPPIPSERCSYYGPSGACEAACPSGSHYGQVPTGAMACIKSDNSPPQKPKDTTCPYGYHNISATNTPNCVPDTPAAPPPDITCPPGTSIVGSAPGYCKSNPDTPAPPVTASPKVDSKTTGPTTTTNNADGSTTTSSSTTTKNTDGSTTTTTTKTTTGADGTKTTETTTSTDKKPGTQEDGKSDGTDADKTNFCKQNPTLNICQNSQVTQADCQATQCTGDAVQCAYLRQQMKAYCESTTANAATDFGTSLMNGSDQVGKGNLPGGASVVQVGNINASSGFLGGGGTCLNDKTFSFHGQSFTLPFSQACQYLVAFRYALMLVALFASFRMVSGVILREA